MLHIDSLSVLDEMTPEEAGMLFMAIAAYQNGREIPLDRMTKLLFAPFKAQFQRDDESYQKTIERNRSNGSKGGRPNNPTEPKETQKTQSVISEPKKADSKKDSNNDSDKDKDNKKIKSSSGKPDSLTFEFLEVYNKFLEEKIGTTEQFSTAGRAGLNKIIGYLRSQVEKKHQGAGVEELANETINAWRWILNNYGAWDKFYQQQLKLEQINSNLLNIINSIKNGTGKKSTPSAEQAVRNAEKMAAEAIAINRAKFGTTEHSTTAEG